MNNIHIEKAMIELKNYCEQFEDCDKGCEFFDLNGCYLFERVPAEYFGESDKEETTDEY